MLYVLSVLKFLVDPLNLVVFVACGLVARSPVVAAVAGAVWGVIVFQLLGEAIPIAEKRAALAVYIVGGVAGVFAVYGAKRAWQRLSGSAG
jgi:hypothetical protein